MKLGPQTSQNFKGTLKTGNMPGVIGLSILIEKLQKMAKRPQHRGIAHVEVHIVELKM